MTKAELIRLAAGLKQLRTYAKPRWRHATSEEAVEFLVESLYTGDDERALYELLDVSAYIFVLAQYSDEFDFPTPLFRRVFGDWLAEKARRNQLADLGEFVDALERVMEK